MRSNPLLPRALLGRTLPLLATIAALLASPLAHAGKVNPLFDTEFPLEADCWVPQFPDDCVWAPDPDDASPSGASVVFIAPAFELIQISPKEQVIFGIELPDSGDVLDVQSVKLAKRGGKEALPGFEVREAPRDGHVVLLRGRWREFHAIATETQPEPLIVGLVLILAVAPDASDEGILESLREMRIAWTLVSPQGVAEHPSVRAFSVESDRDRDGTPDVVDFCPSSDLSPVLTIAGCETSVPNRSVGHGCMMSDSVASCFNNTNTFWEALDCLWFAMLQEEANANLSPDELGEVQKCIDSLRAANDPSSEGTPKFELAIGGVFEPVEEGPAGAPVGDVFRAALLTSENPSPEGAQAWTVAIRSQNARIADISVQGTAGAPAATDPEGFVVNGFEHTELTTNPLGTGAVSSVILSFTSPVTLPPNGTSTLARFWWRTRYPSPDECVTVRFWFEDGLVGSGGPIDNRVVWQNQSLVPETHGVAFRLCGTAANFVTYDCNGDGGMDLADAICHLGSMFLGTEAPLCPGAMDFNGDGETNVADPVALFSYLFLGGGPPAAGLGCASYAGCEPSCS